MKKSLILAGMLCIGYANAQYDGKVGINTSEPKATLDVNAETANLNGTTNEGIIAPKLSKTRIANIEASKLTEGTLVYATDAVYTGAETRVSKIDEKGYYFYNGTEWVKVQYNSISEGSKWTNDNANTLVRLTNLSDGRTARSGYNNIIIKDKGNVGLGTTKPIGKIHSIYESSTQANDGANDLILEDYAMDAGAPPTIIINRNRGTISTPLTVIKDDHIGNIIFSSRLGAVDNTIEPLANVNNRIAEIGSFYKGDGTTNLGILYFNTSANRRMTITEEGKIGIGTDEPSATLTVKALTTAATDKNFEIHDNAGNKKVTVLNSGRVGIGTENPIVPLHTTNGAGHFMRFQTTGVDNQWTDFGKRDNGAFFITNWADDKWNPAIGIKNNGYVGIGLENEASERLDVAKGNMRVRELPNLSGTSSDKIVVVDNTGVLKSVDRTTITGTGVKANDTAETCSDANVGAIHYKEMAIAGATNGEKKGVFGFCTRQNGTAMWVYLSNGGNIQQGTGTFGKGL